MSKNEIRNPNTALVRSGRSELQIRPDVTLPQRPPVEGRGLIGALHERDVTKRYQIEVAFQIHRVSKFVEALELEAGLQMERMKQVTERLRTSSDFTRDVARHLTVEAVQLLSESAKIDNPEASARMQEGARELIAMVRETINVHLRSQQ